MDIVLTTYEAAFTDIQVLRTVPWEALVLDDRYRIKATLHKVHHTLMELPVPYRVMMTSQLPNTFELWLQVCIYVCVCVGERYMYCMWCGWVLLTGVCVYHPVCDHATHTQSCMYNVLFMFLHTPAPSPPPPPPQVINVLMPHVTDLNTLVPGIAAMSPDAQLQALKGALQPHILRTERDSAHRAQLPGQELWIPAALPSTQRDCIKTLLARFYDVLTDNKLPRYSGHKAGQFRTICGELRKVCVGGVGG